MNKHSMKITEKEFDSFFSFEYFLVYGYFSFKRKKNDGLNAEDFGEYQTTVSDMFSRELWSMQHVYDHCVFYEKKENFKEVNTTTPIEMHGMKSEYTKRKFKFINIYNYIKITNLLLDNEEEIKKYFIDDKYSTSKFMTSTFLTNKIKVKKDILSKNKKNILKIDIASFYPSIYTHTIPWVFMSKKEAKKDRKNGFYNELDRYIQISQDGETKGVPTGSGLTKFIVEMYQMKIDEKIASDLKGIYFHRYVDDYHFYYNTEAEKEKILKTVYSVYAEVELQINENKIKTIIPPDHSSDSVLASEYFDKYYGLTVAIIRDEKITLKNKASKIAKIIYNFINYFSALNKEKSLKMPPYFAIENYLKQIQETDVEVFQAVMETDFLFELLGLFLLEPKYLQYFTNFIESNFSEKSQTVKRVFVKYEEIFNDKLEEYVKGDFQVETSYILTLNLLFPYFDLYKTHLDSVIKKSDAFNAIMAYKILFEVDSEKAWELAIARIEQYKMQLKGVEGESIFTFQNENFIFEYEIARIYKNEKDTLKTFPSKYKARFTKEIKRDSNKVEQFYKNMIQENVKIFLK